MPDDGSVFSSDIPSIFSYQEPGSAKGRKVAFYPVPITAQKATSCGDTIWKKICCAGLILWLVVLTAYVIIDASKFLDPVYHEDSLDCSVLWREEEYQSPGVYNITIPYFDTGSTYDKQVSVYCEEHGWTVIQSRGQFGNEKDYFYRNWAEYEVGFGVPGEEHWLGLENIHRLTANNARIDYELKVDLETWTGEWFVATYSHPKFYIDGKDQDYKLHVGSYTGNAGDSLTSWHHGMRFSTPDVDNDGHIGEYNCAQRWKGAWWYRGCHHSNLNGWNYASAQHCNEGIKWNNDLLEYGTLRSARMSIRPIDF